MAQKLRTIAVLAENTAYGSIVEMVLKSNTAWEVRLFSSAQELESFTNVAGIDVLVVDLDFQDNNAQYILRVITRLRQNTSIVKRVIATTRSLLNWSQPQSIGAGIDEVLIKPMSPIYLSERVQALVDSVVEDENTSASLSALKPGIVPTPDNVVSLASWRNEDSHTDA